jgi:hypothetical protein
MNRLPNFLIIGAPRCGTTWLFKCLRQHPDVYMPDLKQLHFFDVNFNKSLNFYAKYFHEADCKRYKAVGEATASYFYRKGVPERIYHSIPGVRLVVIVRNPVERVVSRIKNIQSSHPENIKISVLEKIELKSEIIYEGLYYKHIMRYLKYFRKDQIIILNYHDIENRPRYLLNKVCDFLKIDKNFETDFLNIKINSANSKPHIGRFSFLYHFGILLQKVKLFKLSQFILRYNCVEHELVNSNEEKYIYTKYFQEDISLLKKNFNIDLK